MRTHAGTIPQLTPVKARTNYDSVRTGDLELSGSFSSRGVAGNQWAWRFCFVNNRWFEHPPLPRASGGRHQTTCRPIGPPLQARRDVVDRWEAFRSVRQPLSRCYSPARIPLSQTVSPRPVSSLYL